MNCLICDTENPHWAWTDTHGVAQCMTCGAPYVLLHYEGETNKRLDKPPTCTIKPEFVEPLRRYHAKFKTPIPSGHSFGYSETTQEMASRANAEHFYKWLARQPEVKAIKEDGK